MTLLQSFATGAAAIWLALTALWLLSLRLKDSSIVDIFWGSGFVLVGWVYFAVTDGYQPRQLLLMSMVTLWGLRLTAHLAYRNIGEPEDYRYQQWRNENPSSWWWRSYLKVFMLQGVVMALVSLPLLAAQFYSTPEQLTFLDVLALPLWLIGFTFEAVGDWQLMRFKRNAADDEVLNSGLWRYTRHPNYFGDAVQWWAFALPALAVGAWWGLIAPLLMTYLLLRVSGVAMLERSLKDKKSAYQEYVRRTSAFIPLPPKPPQNSG